MRNLKRVLSLALALVMVLGMMVIGSSAAYTDADQIEYTEAVDVVSMLGVLEGYTDGSFAPKTVLNRAQAAKMLCYILMSPAKAAKLVGSGVFSDMTASTKWAEGYIDYCASLNILKGVGGGKFNPEGELTAVAYGKMLLCALGFDPAVEGYEGDNWATNIAADMIEVGLDVEGVAMDDPLTREAAAQMTFQALFCNLVKYDSKGSSITVGGVEIVAGATAAEAQKDTLADKYFKGLTPVEKDSNEYGVPGHGWTYGDKHVFVAKAPVATYNTYMNFDEGETVAKQLKGYTVNATVITDGVAGDEKVTNAAGIAALTGADVTIALYATDKVIDTIVEIPVHATVVAEGAAADEKTGAAAYVYVGGIKYETEDFAAGDVVLYTRVWNVTKEAYEIVKIDDAKSVTGKVASYTKDEVFTIAGGEYEVSFGCIGDKDALTTAIKGYLTAEQEDHVFYFGADGKIIYATDVKGAPSAPVVIEDYAYVLDVNVAFTKGGAGSTDKFGNPVAGDPDEVTGVAAKVEVVLSNGTSAIYALEVTEKDGVFSTKVGGADVVLSAETALDAYKGKIFTYTLAEGVLTLVEDTKVEAAEGKLTASSLKIDNALIDDNTVVVVRKDVKNAEGKVTGYTYETMAVAALEKSELTAYVFTKDVKNAKDEVIAQVATLIFAIEESFTATPPAPAKVDLTSVVYVGTEYTVSMGTGADGKPATVYTYTGVKVDGTKVAVTGEKDLAAGVYMVKDGAVVALDTNVATATAAKVVAVVGTTYQLDTGVVTIGANVNVVVLAKDGKLAAGAEIVYISDAEGAIVAVYVTK